MEMLIESEMQEHRRERDQGSEDAYIEYLERQRVVGEEREESLREELRTLRADNAKLNQENAALVEHTVRQMDNLTIAQASSSSSSADRGDAVLREHRRSYNDIVFRLGGLSDEFEALKGSMRTDCAAQYKQARAVLQAHGELQQQLQQFQQQQRVSHAAVVDVVGAVEDVASAITAALGRGIHAGYETQLKEKIAMLEARVQTLKVAIRSL